MEFVTGTLNSLPPALVAGMARYRQRVFVQRLGWPLRCDGGLEYDQFDRSDTIYVVAQTTDGEIVGVARLLPTTAPYLLGEVFPALLDGEDIPSSEEVWELSRFAAEDFNASATSAVSSLSARHAERLLGETMAAAKRLGAQRLICVLSRGVERLLRRAGIPAYRVGRPLLVDGQSITANWIPLAVTV